MDGGVARLCCVFLLQTLSSYFPIFHLKALFVWFVVIPFQLLFHLDSLLEVLLLCDLDKLVRTNVFYVFVYRCEHAYTGILVVIRSFSVAKSSYVLKVSLNPEKSTCLIGFEGDSYAKCEKSPDLSCLLGVPISIIEALCAFGSARKHGRLSTSSVWMSMFIDVCLCINFLGNLSGYGLVNGLESIWTGCILGVLNFSIGLCCLSAEVALVTMDENDLDLIILLLKKIK